MSKIINSIDDIPEHIIDSVRTWLGEQGHQFFRELYDQHGTLNTAWDEGGIPHAVHFHEGMQVRNFIRSLDNDPEWQQNHFDDVWDPIVLRAINKGQ